MEMEVQRVPSQDSDEDVFYPPDYEFQDGSQNSNGVNENKNTFVSLPVIPNIRKEIDTLMRSPDARRKSARIRKKSSKLLLRKPDVTFSDLIQSEGLKDAKVESEEPSDDVFISMPSTSSNEDDGYDTDLGDKHEYENKAIEHRQFVSRENTDIGHLSYEDACKTHGATPLRRVTSQLWLAKMHLQHVGLNIKQIKSICHGLLHNTKVEELDLEGNGLDGAGVSLVCDLLHRNKFIQKLSLKDNELQETGAVSVSDMLQLTTSLDHLNLHGCQIGDNEMVHLSTGIQNNESVSWLSMSHNRIGIIGGIQIGRALGINTCLEVVDISWNQIRASGAVSVCKSLQKNHSMVKLDVSWNGLGFEGSLAIGESLKANKTLTILDLSNNRINWDCVPFIGRGLRANKHLEILDLGHNPLSMEGCDELLESIAKPTSGLRHLGLENIPINSKVAFSATEISRQRQFTLHHGGILSTHDIIGIQRVKRKDPMSLLIRYLGTIGIRVIDLFRMFDTENRHYVSKEKFIRGLKRVRAPLDDDDIQEVVRRIGMSKGGQVNYQLLASGVKKHIRDERKEDLRQEALERKRREDRKRILRSDAVMNAPSAYNFPALYNMYGTRFIGRQSTTPMAFSRQGSHNTTPGSFLPKISSDSPRSLVAVSEAGSRRHTPKTPAELVPVPRKKIKKKVKQGASKKKTVSMKSDKEKGPDHLPPLSNLKLTN